MIKLGAKYKDKVTGFTGVATGKSQWLNGCETVGLTPPVDKDGKTVDTKWFDSPRLDLVDGFETILGDQTTGGPHDTPQRGHE